MGERCREYFLNIESKGTQTWALSRERALEWLRRKKWTCWQACLLMQGNDPDLYDDLDDNAISDALAASIVWGKPKSGAVVFANLLGEPCRARRSANFSYFDLEFSPSAFYRCALYEIFPNEKEALDVPCFGLFHDLDAEAEAFLKTADERAKAEPLDDDFAAALFKAGIKTPLGWRVQPEVVLRENCYGDLVESVELISESASNPISFQEHLAIWEGAPLDKEDEETPAIEETKKAADATVSDNIEVVRGITVRQLRGLLDEKNEGTTFCPRLLASIRVELELNAMRAQVKAPNNFTFVYRKSEGNCRKELIEKHCKELRIFNCKDSDAKKRSGNRTITPLDTNAITRVLAHGRELNDGRKKKS